MYLLDLTKCRPASPFEKGGLGGISLQAHIEAAYHRRDAELATLQGLTHD
jgi:hypothetical protein